MSNNMIVKPGGNIALSPEQLNAHRAKQQVENMVREIMWLRSLLARLAASSPEGIVCFDLSQPQPVGNVEVTSNDQSKTVTFKFVRQHKEVSPIVGPGGAPIVHVTPCCNGKPAEECQCDDGCQGGGCAACPGGIDPEAGTCACESCPEKG